MSEVNVIAKTISKEYSERVMSFLQEHGKTNAQLDSEEITRFFSQLFIFTRNDNRISSDLQQFIAHLKRMQQKFPTIHYSNFLEPPTCEGNKIVLRYNADFTSKNDTRIRANIIAIVTFEKNKISQWNEVLNEHNKGGLID